MKEVNDRDIEDAITWIKKNKQFLSIRGIATWCEIPGSSLSLHINGINNRLAKKHQQKLGAWYVTFIKNPLHSP